MSTKPYTVPPDKLRWNCDPSIFSFKTTADIAPLKGIIEQERPIKAIRFGLDIASPGYNIYVSGLTGTGKTTIIKMFLEEIAAKMPRPDDWFYVHNFKDPASATILSLPPGRARAFKAEMSELIRNLKAGIPRAFESKDYEESIGRLMRKNQEAQQALFEKLSGKAREEGFAVEISEVGVSLALLADGKPMAPERYETLGEEEKKRIEAKREELNSEIQSFLRQVRDINKRSRDKVAELRRRVGLYVVGVRIDEIKEQYEEFPKIAAYLRDVQDYILSHLEDFSDSDQKQSASEAVQALMESHSDPFLKYEVNIVVDNTDLKGAPIVIETNPTYHNMFGRVQRRAQFGTFSENFTSICPGSYAKANGGFLVVNAQDVLSNPGVWATLKRAVENREVRIEELGEQSGIVPVAGIRPNPMPADVKVIMIGPQIIYHLLYEAEEDFRKIFKVKADFDSEMPRDSQAFQDYASFIGTRCSDEGLLHFDASGVARVVEYGCRLVENQNKLSARFSDIADIVREANYWARIDGRDSVSDAHVQRAVREKTYRSNLTEERIRELITDGTIRVDIAGEALGQVNGLAVVDLGDIRFGKPSRITAKAYMGGNGVVDIEREAKMSGKIYDKGVLILSGYLGAKYAQNFPLALAASLCFEQSYDGVDGDSASSTELYALLSSLADAPIRQGIAVTGSVDQNGCIQPIGGVNHKIEGFFDLCRTLELTGDQGVMIPVQNVKNLMLREDVVEAVAAGRFHVYAIETIDQGMEILTGRPAGERVEGSYPEGTINHGIERRLLQFAEGLRKFGRDDKTSYPIPFRN
ncbi:MAG: AAA family ATPase [Acidobacteria bacterium]|nr:AAA family ATPase [Acidobacteriota bacterium]